MHEARCLDSSSEISVSSSSILYPAGRSESKWFLSRPSKAEDREREREFSCSKSQTLNQTLSRGTFSVIIHFYSNLFPYGSTFQLFDPNFRDVSVGWVCCQMFVAMCSIPLRCSWAEAVAQQLSCGVMWRCKMRVFGPGPCRFGVCKCHVQ